MTEQQGVDALLIDMIIGSLAGPLCAGGGFCAGSDEIVEHQRISAAAYTFSAALPAMLATTASEVLSMLETNVDLIAQTRENIKTMWAQLDPRSDWVSCTSSTENPMMLLVLKPEVIASKKVSKADQEQLLQDAADEVCPVPLPPSTAVKLIPFGTGKLMSGKMGGTGTGERGIDHSSEKYAARGQRHSQRHWVGAAAGAQGVHYHGVVEKGD